MGYQYIFACKQINLLIEWINEDSIFMVNIDKYLLRSRWKILPKTCLYCLFLCTWVLKLRNKIPKFTANAASRLDLAYCTISILNGSQTNLNQSSWLETLSKIFFFKENHSKFVCMEFYKRHCFCCGLSFITF